VGDLLQLCYEAMNLGPLMAAPEPLGTRIMLRHLRRDELVEQHGTIIVPDSAKDRQRFMRWKIEKVGADCSNDFIRYEVDMQGDARVVWTAEGKEVIVRARAGSSFEWNGEEYMMVDERDIISFIEEEV
jgi:co-chaperonin GroES (HSP10)